MGIESWGSGKEGERDRGKENRREREDTELNFSTRL